MKNQNHKIVNRVMVVGGCFDVLHPGHLDFLKKAHGLCDYLIVLLEPDEKVREMKRAGRPKTNLESRISNLKKTGLIDEVITLPILRTNWEYEKTIKKIVKTNSVRETRHGASLHEIIFYFGITTNDRNATKNQKIRALGKKLGIEVIEINKLLPEWSTSKIVQK